MEEEVKARKPEKLTFSFQQILIFCCFYFLFKIGLFISHLQIMPEGWKFREMGRPGSERRDKEFLSREGFVFRS